MKLKYDFGDRVRAADLAKTEELAACVRSCSRLQRLVQTSGWCHSAYCDGLKVPVNGKQGKSVAATKSITSPKTPSINAVVYQPLIKKFPSHLKSVVCQFQARHDDRLADRMLSMHVTCNFRECTHGGNDPAMLKVSELPAFVELSCKSLIFDSAENRTACLVERLRGHRTVQISYVSSACMAHTNSIAAARPLSHSAGPSPCVAVSVSSGRIVKRAS